MRYPEKEIKTKDGRRAVLRSAEEKDAQSLIAYLKDTSAESRFLLRDPEEIQLTVEQEKAFIQSRNESLRELMIAAEVEGRIVGLCALSSLGGGRRYDHRCNVSVALYQEYCGLGLGRQMMEELLEQAKRCGYEQAELEVVADNMAAVHLYQKLGFQECGRFPRNIKYQDGTYADALFMIKPLV